ncbi:MAG: type II toxin-antitoxin system prevent-host-death family antitoxin [Candidatus Hatepunaea meridiana]|nr:type II toxin-antitoxin system prevent-host-death family antitoxin [Candidatus Hatepunaea meridiana]
MSSMSIAEIRKNLAEALNQVKYNGERIRLKRRNKDVAALVPIEDLEALEELEDRIDIEDAEKALAEYERTGEAISLEDYIAKRDL